MKPAKTHKKDRDRTKAVNSKPLDAGGAEKWAAQICSKLSKSVEAILEIGRVLINAKKQLAHGEWQRLFDERMVPFSQSAAERLMKIAVHPLLSNATHASILPPSWYTLYELTKLPEAQLAQAIDEGRVTPDMPRDMAKKLMLPDGLEAGETSFTLPRTTRRETIASLVAKLKERPQSAEVEAVLSLCEALRDPTTFLQRFEQALARYQSSRMHAVPPVAYQSSFSATQ